MTAGDGSGAWCASGARAGECGRDGVSRLEKRDQGSGVDRAAGVTQSAAAHRFHSSRRDMYSNAIDHQVAALGMHMRHEPLLSCTYQNLDVGFNPNVMTV